MTVDENSLCALVVEFTTIRSIAKSRCEDQLSFDGANTRVIESERERRAGIR